MKKFKLSNPKPIHTSRIIRPTTQELRYPQNIICNTRYTRYNFIFKVVHAQFKYFFNIFFFLVCFSQIFEVYRVSPLISNICPWVLVLFFTLFKEGVDDFQRYLRDRKANSQMYCVVKMKNKMVVCADRNVGVFNKIKGDLDMSVSNINSGLKNKCSDKRQEKVDMSVSDRNAGVPNNSKEQIDLNKNAGVQNKSQEQIDINKNAVVQNKSQEQIDINKNAVVQNKSQERIDINKNAGVQNKSQEQIDINKNAVVQNKSQEEIDINQKVGVQNKSEEEIDWNENSSNVIYIPDNLHGGRDLSDDVDIEVKFVPSSDLKVGDVIFLEKDQRVPADCILLSSLESNIFIRTDQLDGETDWKLRVPIIQNLFIEDQESSSIIKMKDESNEHSNNKEPDYNHKIEDKHNINQNSGNGYIKENENSKIQKSGSISDAESYNIIQGSGSKFGSDNQDIICESNNLNFKDNEFTITINSDKKHTPLEEKRKSKATLSNFYHAQKRRILSFPNLSSILSPKNIITVDKPHKDIHSFIGTFTQSMSLPLTLENTLWMNSILSSGHSLCCIMYTGTHTRAVLNTCTPRKKFGKIDNEINTYSKFLFGLTLIFSTLFTFMRGLTYRSEATIIRFIVILSSVIPISLKVSIDWARYLYSVIIQMDIPGCCVRNSNIPEELGRISYLLSDKTGTLTKNEMEMRKVHLGTVCYTEDCVGDIRDMLHKRLCDYNVETCMTNKDLYECSYEKCYLNESMHNNNIINVHEKNEKKNDLLVNKSINIKNNERIKTHKTDEHDNIEKNLSNVEEYKMENSNSNAKKSKIGNTNFNLDEYNIENNDSNIETYNAENNSSDIGKKKMENNSSEIKKYNANNSDNLNLHKIENIYNDSIPSSSLSKSTNSIKHSKNTVLYSNTDLGDSKKNRKKHGLSNKVYDLLIGLSLCHNVTPVTENEKTSYQASSPDEIAIIEWTNKVGMQLIKRTRESITLKDFVGTHKYIILHIFPFTSERKRMGIIIKDQDDNISLYIKGADTVMKNIVKSNDWLDDETCCMAREGLRTLVIGKKKLSKEEYDSFNQEYCKASTSMTNRKVNMEKIVISIENNLNILGLTGVEDKLQEDIKNTLESLRYAGMKIWMLTGDKIETATCIAISSKLFSKTGKYKIVENITTREDAFSFLNIINNDNNNQNYRNKNNLNFNDKNYRNENNLNFSDNNDKKYRNENNLEFNDNNNYLDYRNKKNFGFNEFNLSNKTSNYNYNNRKYNCNKIPFDYLIIDGKSIETFMEYYTDEFISFCSQLEAVVCCRCSPTQKSDIALALRRISNKRVACVGDGGNDVSMITSADIGIGIVGKEGKQASLASDFSIEKFKDIAPLFLWHGRNCYKGTARLSNLIIHRGTTISVMQAIFCCLFEFSPISLYQGPIIIGYVTLYTFLPVFSSILSSDTTKEVAMKFPEIYKDLRKKKLMSVRSFALWNTIAFYQGALIMILAFYFFEKEMFGIITITFSSLILNELMMVFLVVRGLSKNMAMSIAISLFFYIMSFFILKDELVIPCGIVEFISKVVFINVCAILFSIVEKIYSVYVKPSQIRKLGE